MTRSSKLQRECGLEDVDVLLMRYLSRYPHATPSAISRELSVPRTTVHFRLNKLAERELCELKKVRNLSTWVLTALGSSLLIKSKERLVEISIGEGIDAFEETMISLAAEPHPSRVYMFEPSEQTRLFTQHTNEKIYSRVSDLIKKHDIIVEALIGERTLEYVREMGEEVRVHMHGRPTIAYEIPDNVLNFEQVIICFSEDVYFFNYKTLRLTHISSKEIANNYRLIFKFYKTFGKKVNFNEVLKV